MRLYAVTDRSWLGNQTLAEQVEDALKGGVTCVQLREKELDEEAFLQEAVEIKALCKKYHVPLIINDNVEIAIKCGADGVHVGQKDMEVGKVRALVGKDMLIGTSARTVEQALAAEQAGADYLGVGAVFGTATKSDAKEISHEVLRDICKAVSIPVCAIGGICKGNIQGLKGTEIDGVAVVSGIFSAIDIEKECKELRTLSEELFCGGKVMKTALSIAGSDCSGGAGIQADIKTMTMNGVYAMSAITALTAQNTTGVSAISEVTPEFLANQIDMIFADIRPDAVKIGMVSSAELIKTIVERLKYYQATNIVVDPVMVATSGASLLENEAVSVMKKELLPIAAVITPNIPEAEVLSGMKITTKEDMEKAALALNETYGCDVLLKGGHNINDANDLLCQKGAIKWFYGKRIDNPNTHGTGCTLSSAIAANLAKGYELEESVQRAKDYISGALADMLALGSGSGPMNHAFNLTCEYKKEAN